ncbi:MAG TPA: glycoside hydrolase family 3 protein [Candidatus Saccharimonadales bacterium]|jgi:beta-N-acetylhexosaminidase|nr:glycoside hydrolase family 3 protein [Candidatus Saccharimonadales bacterium]
MRKNFLLVCVLILALNNSLLAGGYQHPAPVRLDHEGERWAQRTLKRMSLEEKIGQMFMVRVFMEFMNVENPDYVRLRGQIARFHLGSVLMTVPVDGPLLIKSEPYEAAMLANSLQRASKYPLIVAADFERGVSMRLNGVTVFPHAMAFGAAGKASLAEQFGRIVAEESRAVGVEWNFFPVADVNSNPANPIINTRSFGEDPEQVSMLLSAYIEGAKQAGMLTTVKHFPGHGDTGTDSHLGVAVVNRSREQIEQVDLAPFRAAISAGVDSIMTAHVSVPALEPNPKKVATTSSAVVTGLLRKEMGFKGIVATDAMEMGALTRLYPEGGAAAAGRAAVDAVRAGNDMLLLPSDLEGAYDGVLRAVHSGEISETRIDESVLRILRAKAMTGLNKATLVDLGTMATVIARPQSAELAQKVAESSITLVRENGHLLPLKIQRNRRTSGAAPAYGPIDRPEKERPESGLLCVIFTDDVRMENGRQLERALRSRVPDVKVLLVDPRIAGGMAGEVDRAVTEAAQVIAAVYIIPTAGKAVKNNGTDAVNSVALAGTPSAVLQALLEKAHDKTVVVAFGSPYIAADYPQIENYVCAYSHVTVSELAAVRALFGEIPIQGHLPVTIPGFAKQGTGIQKAAQ